MLNQFYQLIVPGNVYIRIPYPKNMNTSWGQPNLTNVPALGGPPIGSPGRPLRKRFGEPLGGPPGGQPRVSPGGPPIGLPRGPLGGSPRASPRDPPPHNHPFMGGPSSPFHKSVGGPIGTQIPYQYYQYLQPN